MRQGQAEWPDHHAEVMNILPGGRLTREEEA